MVEKYFWKTNTHQHLADFLSLVPLQLHHLRFSGENCSKICWTTVCDCIRFHLSVLWMLDYGPVASELLLGHFHNLLEVILGRETLARKYLLPPTLLSSHNVYEELKNL